MPNLKPPIVEAHAFPSVLGGAVCTLAALFFIGCGDDATAPSIGALRVMITTTGHDLDPDGYLCSIEGESSRAVATNDTTTFTELEPGDHVVLLSDLSANCSVAGGHQRSATVVPGDTTETTFDVTCAALEQLSISLLPADWRMPVGEQVRFHASVQGPGDHSITWTVNDIPGGNTDYGTIDGDGLYSAPTSIPGSNPVTVRAASVSDPATFRESPVTITPSGVTGYALWSLWKPRVITLGTIDSVEFEVGFTGYPRFELELSSGAARTPVPVRSGVYEFRLSTAEVLTGYENGDLHNFVGRLNSTGFLSRVGSNVHVNVSDATVPSVSVTQLADDIQAASHVVNIRYDDLYSRPVPTTVLERFYAVFPDDFDFVAVVKPLELCCSPGYQGLRNDIDGLGLQRFDSAATYGGAQRLQGLIDYDRSDAFDVGGPSTIRAIGHRWMAYLNNEILAPSIPDWPISSMARGIIQIHSGLAFPYTVQRVTDDVYELVCSERADEFNDLELYLMGLIPADSVSTHVVFRLPPFSNPSCGDQSVTDSITIQDIVAVNGARNPDYQNSQKDFRLAAVVLSAGRLLSLEEMAFFNHMAKRGEATTELHYTHGLDRGTTKPFYLATGRRAALTTRVLP